MSDVFSEASYADFINEISPYLYLKELPPIQPEESLVIYENSGNTLNNVPTPIFDYDNKSSPGDAQLEIDMDYDSPNNSNDVLEDIVSFNTAKKTKNIDESQDKGTLEDFKCNKTKNNEEIYLPNENQSDSEIIEQVHSLKRIKCTDVNYDTHNQGLQSSSIQKGNEGNSLNNVHSESMHETENYKKKHYKEKYYKKRQLVRNTAQAEERHCNYKGWDVQTAIDKKNLSEKMFSAVQEIKQQVETKESIIGRTNVGPKLPKEAQFCQTVEAITLMDQLHFSAKHSSEIQDNFKDPTDTKDTYTFAGIMLNKLKVKNEETTTKSNLCQIVICAESSQNFSSPGKISDSDERFYPESRSICNSSDVKFQTAVTVPVRSACSNGDVNSINKTMVYSGKIAELPCTAINEALSQFHSKSSNEPKKTCIPSESNVPIVTIYPVMEPCPNTSSLNTAPTGSSPPRQTISHIPAILGAKRKQRNGIKNVELKSILPSTINMVAECASASVDASGSVASSGTYNTVETCDQKLQALGSSLSKNTLILPSSNATVGNNEVTQSAITTQSSFELAPVDITVPEISITSLSILPSIPKEFSDTCNISVTQQSTAVSTVNVSNQELENEASINNLANQNIFTEDLSHHLSSTEALSSVRKHIPLIISPAENKKLNFLPNSDAVSTEDAMVSNMGKQQMVKIHSNSNDLDIRNVQKLIRKIKLDSRTTRKKKNKVEGAIGVTKVPGFVHSTRKKRQILPKCGSEIKRKENANDHDFKSSIANTEQMNIQKTETSCDKIRIQKKNKIIKSKESIFPDDSTNKLDILNNKVIPHLSNDHKIIDNLMSESKNEPNRFIENITPEQDFSGKGMYSARTSKEFIYNSSGITYGSDKRLQETVYMPHGVNNVNSNFHPSVFKLPYFANEHYQTRDTQRYPPNCDTVFYSEPGYFSAKYDYSRKFCHNARYDINADKGFNNFAANNQTSPFSASISGEKCKTQVFFANTVHPMVPTTQIANTYLPNGDTNMFLNDNRFDNYNNMNANKGFNNVAANIHTPFSTSINSQQYNTQAFCTTAVHPMAATSQIANTYLPNGDTNMFLKDNRFDNYNTKFNADNCKFAQKTHSNLSENESANKGFNYFAANNQTSTSINGQQYNSQAFFPAAVHPLVPTAVYPLVPTPVHPLLPTPVHPLLPASQFVNPYLPNGDINMLKDNRFDNCNIKFNPDNDKFIQKTDSDSSGNENNWHNRYVHQQFSQVPQNHDTDINISLGKNVHNAHCQTNNECKNEIGPSIQNLVITEKENSLLFSKMSFCDTLSEPHPSTKQIKKNYKKKVRDYLQGTIPVKGDGDAQQLQNNAMQEHTQSKKNKIISPICKQEKINMQHFGKYCKYKGASKFNVKSRDKPYMCDRCGKFEQYNAVLQRHIRMEHVSITAPMST